MWMRPKSVTAHGIELPVGDSPPVDPDRDFSPWRVLWRKLNKNRAAMLGLYVLILLYGCSIFAGFVAPYSYDRKNTDYAFHPPMLTLVRFRAESGRFTWPFVYGVEVVDRGAKGYRGYREEKSSRSAIRFLARGDEYRILWLFTTNIHLFGVDEGAVFFPLGSDYFGRDIFSRVLYGSQISLSVGILGILISTTIGMFVGGVSGFFGGITDFLSMRVVEVILAIPSLYFILILSRTLGSDLSSTGLFVLISVVLSLIGWATQARVIRGLVLTIREKEYVVAARALGFSPLRIIVRHILPNTFSFVIVTATLTVPFYILSEVALSFLGVGIQEPTPSWGNMLSDAQNVSYLTDYTWILAPGFFIFVAVMAWNFLGDGLRDAADPRTLN